MIRALDINKNKICLNDINENDNLFILCNIITNLYLCNPNYIKDVLELIKRENVSDNFELFLDYFESQYLKKFPIESWNYYKNSRHLTNNSCEAYNCKLRKLFSKNPVFLNFYMN